MAFSRRICQSLWPEYQRSFQGRGLASLAGADRERIRPGTKLGGVQRYHRTDFACTENRIPSLSGKRRNAYCQRDESGGSGGAGGSGRRICWTQRFPPQIQSDEVQSGWLRPRVFQRQLTLPCASGLDDHLRCDAALSGRVQRHRSKHRHRRPDRHCHERH